MRIVVLTGAGISRESGLSTFRDADGLWAGYRIEDVCTPKALAENPQKVLDFYNLRRREVAKVEPNPAHFALAELQKRHEVNIVTQNIDDLHERAGSRGVLHLHGEIFKARSISNFDVVQEIRGDFHVGDLSADGCQLRPHICFFHEMPYRWDEAVELAESADLFAVIGTSLQVYPAAGLVEITRAEQIVLIDPNPPEIGFMGGRLSVVAEPASVGVPMWADSLTATV
jgi:NAD-dependent deacetylase